MESIYLDYLRLDESKSRDDVDEPFLGLLSELKKRGVSYHFINEKIAEKVGRVKKATHNRRKELFASRFKPRKGNEKFNP